MISSRLRLILAFAALVLAVPAAFGGCGNGDCSQQECFRAVSCVTACGTTPVQVGCCACPDGTFDDITCTGDAGADGG